LFVVSLLPQGVGFADHLLLNVISIMANEIDSSRNVNAYWESANPSAEATIYSAYVASHYLQKAPMIINGGYDPVMFGATFTGAGVNEPYPPSAVVNPSRIYTLRIAEYSPDHNDQTHLDDPYDYEAIQATIAHEIGHHVGLSHTGVNGACPPPLWTVMVDAYFRQTANLNECSWNMIPHDYSTAELLAIILR
jgi:hypothetical protein